MKAGPTLEVNVRGREASSGTMVGRVREQGEVQGCVGTQGILHLEGQRTRRRSLGVVQAIVAHKKTWNTYF